MHRSYGCEAVSNAIPNFKSPSANAEKSVVIAIIYSTGAVRRCSLLATYTRYARSRQTGGNNQIADMVFGRSTALGGIAFYMVTGSVF